MPRRASRVAPPRASKPAEARPGRTAAAAAIDAVCLSTDGHDLLVLSRTGNGARELPWDLLDDSAPMQTAAMRLVCNVMQRAPTHLEQLGAYADGLEHPSAHPLSVAFIALMPMGSDVPDGHSWDPIGSRFRVAARQRVMLADAVQRIRDQVSVQPIAFRLLPPRFTLTELQRVYELLLGHPVHKASFRRSLSAAGLVQPTDKSRSLGRGRPAQFHRYKPRDGGKHRPLRFDVD